MRMWLIDPRLLCMKHLKLEHKDLHSIVKNLNSGINLDLYIVRGDIDPSNVFTRHEIVEQELQLRGVYTNSPLHKFECKALETWYGKVNINLGRSLSDLSSACPSCHKRISSLVSWAVSQKC